MFSARSLCRFARPTTAPRAPFTARQFQTSTRLAMASKNALDKDSMNIESNEYNKSGSDQGAAQDDAAFDPNTTRPESEGAESAKSEESNNHEVSKPKDGNNEASGSPQQSGKGSTDRSGMSGGGSPKKSG